MNRACAASIALASILAGACAKPPEPHVAAAPRGFSCSAARGHATTIGERAARAFALQAASYEARDLKGDFIRAGFKSVRKAGEDVACQPYSLSGKASNVVFCVAAIRICGR